MVVDVVAAIEASDAWTREESRLVELAQQMQAESEAMKDEITTIQDDLQSGILTPDSPERMRLEDQLLEKANAFRAMQRHGAGSTRRTLGFSSNCTACRRRPWRLCPLSEAGPWSCRVPRLRFQNHWIQISCARDFGPIGLARRTCRGRDHDRDQPDERALNRPTTAQELATCLHAEVIGDPSRMVVGPAAPEHATSDDVIAVSGTAWLAVAKASAAGIVVLRKQDLPAYGDAEGKTLILVEDAPLRRTLELFAPEEDVPASGVHPSAVVDPSAVWAKMFVSALLFRLGPGHVWPKGSFLNLGHMWVPGKNWCPNSFATSRHIGSGL